MFYMAHPTKRDWYIQCDAFGKAFVHQCPAMTVFSENLACERPSGIVAKQQITGAGYGNVQQNMNLMESSSVVVAQVESVKESPEFMHMCAQARTQGRLAFYMPHPASAHMFIQCDEFGKAFARICPTGTWFSENAVCEVKEQPIVSKQTVTAYGQQETAAPVAVVMTTNYEQPQTAPLATVNNYAPQTTVEQPMAVAAAAPYRRRRESHKQKVEKHKAKTNKKQPKGHKL